MAETQARRYEAAKVGTVTDLGDIYQLAAPLPEQIDAFKRAGCQAPYFPDVAEKAQIRLARIFQNCTRTSIAPVAVKGERTILTREPLLMSPTMARLAVNAHRDERYLEIPGIYDVVRQIAEQEFGKEPEDRTALILSQEGEFEIRSDSDEAKFLFRRQRELYFGEFVPSGIIPLVDLKTDSKAGVVNYLAFYYLTQGRSGLICRVRNLDHDLNAFGVRRVSSGEASAPRN